MSSFAELAPIQNPLLMDFSKIQSKISDLKEKTKQLYFRAVLGMYKCPTCSGKLKMIQDSQCSCSNGHVVDPTLAFQKSTCCGSQLIRKSYHYTCSHCKIINASRFLFDERIFDRDYFSKMMRKHRDRIQKRKELIIKQLQEARSEEFVLLDEPHIESLPGLVEDLDQFVKAGNSNQESPRFVVDTRFAMSDYRCHILSALECGSRYFTSISNLGFDTREDRVFRFVTLVFMQHDSEVEITQYDGDLLIERLI